MGNYWMKDNRLRELRRAKGLTQQEVADKLGCTTSTVDWYEKGKMIVAESQIKQMEMLLGEPFEAWGYVTKDAQVIGAKIQQTRQMKGMTIPEFAKYIGVGHTTMKRWLYGHHVPQNEYLERFAKIHEVSVTEFISCASESAKKEKEMAKKELGNLLSHVSPYELLTSLDNERAIQLAHHLSKSELLEVLQAYFHHQF